ncbi:cytochrome P450 [Streptomyces sp. DSM 44917]|uniref:Cytochrome P450 n=2 Tax=Streptomyces boetiae TaxID=3075541 RepID=A0ABU2L1F7_9ACTN|nr:cytochrome P450 [Streptomyces sp. DSM 44917]MDT0305394.1 cytochrome P450 [Streptomyces sp. DSM 44917]
MRQRHGAVVPVLLPGDIPAWLVIGYRELHQVTGDTTLFTRDMGLWNQWPNIPEDWPLLPMINRRQPSIYYTVGAEHKRHVDMVVPALEGVDASELRRHAEYVADALIDAFCGLGEAELIGAYARRLPILVLARVVGFPDAEGPDLADAMNALADGGRDALAGHQYLTAAMTRLVAAKRAAPGADIASRMLAVGGADFTDEEYLLDLQAITAAGHLPTADWIGNSLRLMLTDGRFAASLTGGRHSVGHAMNEVLWEDTPTQILAGRWTSRDTYLAGRRLRAGDLLLLGLQGAHGDPQVHEPGQAAPGGYAAYGGYGAASYGGSSYGGGYGAGGGLGSAGGRHLHGNSAHFAFSHGEFRCPFPAQEISETIARTGLEVLLDRLPDIDLAVPPETLRRRPSPFLRGMTALPVRFTPTPTTGTLRPDGGPR